MNPARFFRNLNLLSFLIISLLTVRLEAQCINGLNPTFEQGKLLFDRGQFLLASVKLSLVHELACDSSLKLRSQLGLALSLFELGETIEADLILQQFEKSSPVHSKAQIIRAWYQPDLVSRLSEVDQNRFDVYEEIKRSAPKEYNPWISGALSALVPGMGQLYNRNYQSAAMSFVLNALFLSASMELAKQGLHATAMASGVVLSVFYVGNIVGTVKSSQTLNENQNLPLIKKTKDSLFPEFEF